MANELEKICKLGFKTLFNICRGLQIAFLFLSAFTILFWVVDLSNTSWNRFALPFFNHIYSIVATFYDPAPLANKTNVDFTYLIASAVMIIISILLRHLYDIVAILEAKYLKYELETKRNYQNNFNKTLQNSNLNTEIKKLQYCLRVKFDVNEISSFRISNTTAPLDKTTRLEDLYRKFCTMLANKMKFNVENLPDGFILEFDNINYLQDILDEISIIIKNFKTNLKNENLDFTWLISMDLNHSNVKTSLEKMIELSIKNNFTFSPEFKYRIDLLKNLRYEPALKGCYKLYENKEDIKIYLFKNKEKPEQ